MGCANRDLSCLLVAMFFLSTTTGGGGGMVKVSANTMVTGTVFCDQCKDGLRSFFDFPLDGAKVAVKCVDGGTGAVMMYQEENTNWLGSYTMRFDGSPDLSGCYARVVEGPSGCSTGAGPARELTPVFRMLGMAMYAVEPLLAQPLDPVGFCANRGNSAPPLLPPLPPFPPLPALPRPPPLPPVPMLPLLPPPMPWSRPPPLPLPQASACPYDKWMMPEYKCYWKLVSPHTKVALAFGPIAAQRYGMDMTLWEGLQGRGDLYRTLLREGTTALLNSYNSLRFSYPTLSVIEHMNQGLLGSRQQALMTALRFRRANSGASGNVSCNFSPCS